MSNMKIVEVKADTTGRYTVDYPTAKVLFVAQYKHSFYPVIWVDVTEDDEGEGQVLFQAHSSEHKPAGGSEGLVGSAVCGDKVWFVHWILSQLY